uniref:Uncharacterized protein n=1 Tax=Oryctolagus cuniculus TaxID=9986 RepID=G1U9D6_RABIT
SFVLHSGKLSLSLGACVLPHRKPVSLSYRCPCRFFESHVARANVKHLKILNTPNCALQIVATRLGRQLDIEPQDRGLAVFLDPSGAGPWAARDPPPIELTETGIP